MARLAIIGALALLSACGGNSDWRPTPGATIAVGQSATTADPLPADCGDVDHSGSTLDGKPIVTVVAATATTVTVRSPVLLSWTRTVPTHCLVPYVLR